TVSIAPCLTDFSSNSLYLVSTHTQHYRSASISTDKHLLGALSISVFHSLHIHHDTNRLVLNFQVLSLRTAQPISGATIRLFAASVAETREATLLECDSEEPRPREKARGAWRSSGRKNACLAVQTDSNGFATWVSREILEEGIEVFATVVASIENSSPSGESATAVFVTDRLNWPWEFRHKPRLGWEAWQGGPNVLAGYDRRFFVPVNEIRFFLLTDRSSFRPGEKVSLHGLLSTVNASLCGFHGACLLHHALRLDAPEKLRVLVGAQWPPETGGHYESPGVHASSEVGSSHSCTSAVVSLNRFGAFSLSLKIPADAALGSRAFLEYRIFKAGDVDEAALSETACPETWYQLRNAGNLKHIDPAGGFSIVVEDPKPPSVVVSPLKLPAVVDPASALTVSGSVQTYAGLPVQDHRVEVRFAFQPSFGETTLRKAAARLQDSWNREGKRAGQGASERTSDCGRDFSKFLIGSDQVGVNVVTTGEVSSRDTVHLHAEVRTDAGGQFELPLVLEKLTVAPSKCVGIETETALGVHPLDWEEGTEISVTVRVTGLTGDVLPPQTASVVVASSEFSLARKLSVSVRPVLPGVPFAVTAVAKPYPGVKATQLPTGSWLEVSVLRVDPQKPLGSSWEAQADNWNFWNSDQGLASCQPSLFSEAGASESAERVPNSEYRAVTEEAMEAFTDGAVDLALFVEKHEDRFSIVKKCRGHGERLSCPVTLPLDAAQYIFLTTMRVNGRRVRTCEYFLPTAGNLLTRALKPDLQLYSDVVAPGQAVSLVLPALFRPGSSIRPRIYEDRRGGGEKTGPSRQLRGALSVWWHTQSNRRLFFSVSLDSTDDELRIPIGRVPEDCPASCSVRVVLVPPLSETPLPISQVDTSSNALMPKRDYFPIETEVGARYGPFLIDETLSVMVRPAASPFVIPENVIRVSFNESGASAREPRDAELKPGKTASIRVALLTRTLEKKSALASFFSRLTSPQRQIRAYAFVGIVDKRYFDLGPVDLPQVEEEFRQRLVDQNVRQSVSSSFAEAASLATYLYLFQFLKVLKERDPWVSDLHWPQAGLLGATALTSSWAPWSKTLRNVLLGRTSTLTGSFAASPRGENLVDGVVFAQMSREATAMPMMGAGVMAQAKRSASTASRSGDAEVSVDSGETHGVAAAAKLLLSDTPLILWKSVELSEGETPGELSGEVVVRVPDDSNRYLLRTQVVVEVEESEAPALSFFRRLWTRAEALKLSRVFYGQFEKEVVAKKRVKLTPFRPKLLRKGDLARVGAILQVDETLVSEGREAVVSCWFPERNETQETGHRQRVKLTKTALPVTVQVDTDDPSLILNNRLQVSCFAQLASDASFSHGIAFAVPVVPMAPRLSLSSVWAMVSPRAFKQLSPGDGGAGGQQLEPPREDSTSVTSVEEKIELPLPVLEGVGGLSASVGVGYGAVLLGKIHSFLSAEICPFLPAKQAHEDLLWDVDGRRRTDLGSKKILCTCCLEAFPAAATPFFERRSPSLSALLLVLLARQVVKTAKLQMHGELVASARFAETKLTAYLPADPEIFRRVGFLPRPSTEYTPSALHELRVDLDVNLLVLLVAKRQASSVVLPYVASVAETIRAFLRDAEARFLALDSGPSPGDLWPQPVPLIAASEPGVDMPDSQVVAQAASRVGRADAAKKKREDFTGFLAFVGPDLLARIRYVLGSATPLNLVHPEAEEALAFPSLLAWTLSAESRDRESAKEQRLSPHLLWALVVGLEHREEANGRQLLALAHAVLKAAVGVLRFLPDSAAYFSRVAGGSVPASDAQHALLIQIASFLLSATSAERPAPSPVFSTLDPELFASGSERMSPESIVHVFSKVLLYLARGGMSGQQPLGRMVPWTGGLFRNPWEDLLVMDAVAQWHTATKSDRADLSVSVELGSEKRSTWADGDKRLMQPPWLSVLRGQLSLRRQTAVLEKKLSWTDLDASEILKPVSFVSSNFMHANDAVSDDAEQCTWHGKVRVNVHGEGVALVSIAMDFVPDRSHMLPTFMGALLQKEFLPFNSATEQCENAPVASVVRGNRVCVSLRVTVKDELRDVTIRDILPAGLELSSRDPSMSPLAVVDDAFSSVPPSSHFPTVGKRGSASFFWFLPRCEPRLLGNAVEWKCPHLAAGTHTLRVIAIATVSGFFAVPMATVEVGTDEEGGGETLSGQKQADKVTLLGASGAAKRAFVVLEEGERQLAANEVAIFKEAGLQPPPAWLLGSAPKGCGVCPAGTVCSPALGKCVS
ncbi:hypothetical protein TGRUB_215910B, partial [Toxoplasma gondii RUB]